MQPLLSFGKDVQGLNAYATDFTDFNYIATLAINTATSITVPSNFQNWIAIFSFTLGQNIFVAKNQTATVPVGTTLAISSSQLLDSQARKKVQAGDTISVISNLATRVCISLYPTDA